MSLISRDAELSQVVDEALAALEARRGAFVLIEGQTGIGKTSLLGAALAELRLRRPGVGIGTGRCRADAVISSSDPCPAFTSALRELAGTGERHRGGLRGLLAELAPSWLQVVPLVGGILSALTVTVARLRRRSAPDLQGERLVRRYLKAVRRLASDRPIVIAIGDLHWADTGSVALLAHLIRGVADLPVVVLGTRRMTAGHRSQGRLDEVVAELERERLASRKSLEELPLSGRRSLLRRELGGPAAAELERAVESVAGGNPRLLVETCALLREGRSAQRVDGEWRLTAPRLPLPPSAEHLSRERLQGLAPADILLLQYASVEGKVFSSTVVAALMEESELDILDRLESLAREHGVVGVHGEANYRSGEVGTLFGFADAPLHAFLTREVTGRRRVVLESRLRETLLHLHGELGGEAAETPEAKAARDRPAGPTSLPPGQHGTVGGPLVGRDSELALLAEAIGEAFAGGGGRALFVRGPAGAGKSTLARALLEKVAAEHPSAAIARGRCLPSFEATEPYLAFVTALLDVVDEESAGFVDRDRVSDLLVELAPFWLSAVPVVGNVLSASLSTATALRGEVQSAPSQEALFAQYLDLVRGLSAGAPLLLFLDDLHWADASTVALLGHLARGLGSGRVVILGTLRPAEDGRKELPATLGELVEEGIGRVVELEELGTVALESLLRAELGGDVSEPLRRWIVGTAGGNPLFASELCRLLRETGAAAPVMGEWQLTKAADGLGVPRSAEAVIERRIARLPAETLRLLQHASVAGSSFSDALLAGLIAEETERLAERLGALEADTQLVVSSGRKSLPSGRGVALYEFRHALVHTVLYRGLTHKRRILLHRRAGEILEALHEGAEETVAARLARHFHEGRVGERAYRYGRTAADAARRAFANWDAEELLRIALQHVPTPAHRSEVLEVLGDVYDFVGYYDRCLDAWRNALEAPGNGTLRVRRKMVVAERKAGLTPASRLLERAEKLLAEAEREPIERCHLLMELVRYPGFAGAMDASQEAVRTAESVGDTKLLAQALELRAVLLVLNGQPAEALPALERALDLVGREDPVRGSFNHNVSGVARAKIGDYLGAIDSFRAQLEMEERTGDQNGIGAACVCLGAMLRRTGQLEEAEEVLQRARAIHERRDRASLVQSLLNLAERARWAGELEVAAERFGDLIEVAREIEYAHSEAVGWGGLGLCLLQAGRVDEALAAAAAAERVLEGREDWFEDREFVELLKARLDAHAGRVAEAAERLRQAADELAEADRHPWGLVQLERARLLLARDPAEAERLVDEVASATEGTPSVLSQMVETLRRRLAVLEHGSHSAVGTETRWT